ncbi:MAG: leucine-rich repeat domain-containing protein [Bacteroidales bacterium]|nr:leucine-rich repeat domain-containing protein [Bacteroidales bacterium]
MKRFFLLSILMLLVFGAGTYAQDTESQEAEVVDSMHFKYCGIRYAFEENKRSLYVDINYNEETPTQVNIMRQIKINGKFYPVKRIGAKAFYGCRNITCVTIPDNVEIIDSSAFRWCVNLSNLGISSNVKRIGPDCFRNCTNLRSFHFPSGLTVISPGAFRASGLMEIVLPEGLQEICSYAFEGCKALAAVRFPKSLRIIGKEAFSNCWALKTVSLYDNVRRVEEGAFMSCRSLTTVIFTKVQESYVKTIVSRNAFAECRSLTTVACNTSRIGNVKDVLFHEEAFTDCKFNVDNVLYGGKPISDPSVAKRKKGEAEFEDEEAGGVSNATRLRTSETVERARKDIGVRKNTKNKKK